MKVTAISGLRGSGCLSFLLVLICLLSLAPTLIYSAAISTPVSSNTALEVRAADTQEHDAALLDVLKAEPIETSLETRESDATEHNYAVVCQLVGEDDARTTRFCVSNPYRYRCDANHHLTYSMREASCSHCHCKLMVISNCIIFREVVKCGKNIPGWPAMTASGNSDITNTTTIEGTTNATTIDAGDNPESASDAANTALVTRDTESAEHNFAIVCQRWGLDSRDQTAICQGPPWHYGCDQQGTLRKNQANTRCTIGCRCVNVRLGCIYNKQWLAQCSAADETSDSFLVEGQTFANASTIDSGAGIDSAAPEDKA